MQAFESFEFVLRLVAAILCASLLGWERQAQEKPAGLRTHMLVALGAAAATVATLQFVETSFTNTLVRLDPIRVLAAIVGGIGFLGAGSIIRSGAAIEGITTAASIWVAGAIGLACGLGLYPVAVATAVIAFLILQAARVLER